MGFGTLKFKSVLYSIEYCVVSSNLTRCGITGVKPYMRVTRLCFRRRDGSASPIGWQHAVLTWCAGESGGVPSFWDKACTDGICHTLQLLFSYSSATPPLILACDFSWNLPHAILIHFDPFWTCLLKKTAQWLEESLANALQRKMHMHVCLTRQIEMLRNKACIWGEGENREREWHAKASADLLETEVYWACFSFRQQ